MGPTRASTLANLQQTIDDLRRQLDERTAERDESEAQKAALAEVLGVINSSPGDLAPVFDVMLDKALRLCDAGSGALLDHSGERLRVVRARGVPLAAVQTAMSVPATPGGAFGTMLGGAPVVQIADLKDGNGYRNGDPARRMMV